MFIHSPCPQPQREAVAIPRERGTDRRSRHGGRLLRRYALYMAGLLSAALLASGGIGAWFTYRDTRILVDELQREKAKAAATRIEQFIAVIERQLRGMAIVRHDDAPSIHAARHVELVKLLRLAPAVSDAAWIDPQGRERVRVSRLDPDVVGGAADRSSDPGFLAAREGRTWYGDIEFRRQSEPHLAVAVPGEARRDGVAWASINLRFVADVVSAIRVGESGHAYVVDAHGRLLSHPDAGRVLRATSLAGYPQVRAALAAPAVPASPAPTIIARDDGGRLALSAHAPVAGPGWHVLVEQPLAEAFAALYGSLARAALLLLAGIAIAIAASVALARRMAAPIRHLELGAQRVGEGQLDERVSVATGDELQGLAEQFNRMADRLRESHRNLERRIAERTRQLEESNRDKARFLAAASHDLRQPVHALGLFVAQLQETRDAGERERLIDKVAASSAAVSALIEALLDISRLDAGAVECRPVDFPLQSLFDRIEHAFAADAQAKGLRFRVRPTHARVRTDPVLLERVLLNLCANAIRYTPQGGAIVAARRRAGGIRIEVRDTGIGIEPHQQPRIFEEFYQAGAAPDGGLRGLGLGLAIVERLARLLELRVELRSRPGRGSLFALDVPQAASAPGALPAQPDPVPGTRFAGLAVLLIDDDPPAREATGGLLAQWGCVVTIAAGADEALGRLRAGAAAPHLVVCDYRLAGGERGTVTVAAVRAYLQQSVPAVIVTGDASRDLHEAVAAAGLHLMHKPINAARLRALVAHVAAGHAPAAMPVSRS